MASTSLRKFRTNYSKTMFESFLLEDHRCRNYSWVSPVFETVLLSGIVKWFFSSSIIYNTMLQSNLKYFLQLSPLPRPLQFFFYLPHSIIYIFSSNRIFHLFLKFEEAANFIYSWHSSWSLFCVHIAIKCLRAPFIILTNLFLTLFHSFRWEREIYISFDNRKKDWNWASRSHSTNKQYS